MGNPLIAVSALSHHATLQARQGRLHRARETYERALQWATDPQGGRLPIASEALIGLGRLRREWNDLEAAADHLTESIELASRWSELAAFDAYFPLAATRLAQGDVQAAQEAIEAAQRLADRSEITQLDDLLADLQQARFSISQGDVEGATQWAESRGLIPGPSPASHLASDDVPDFISAHLHKYEQIMLARLFLLQGRAVEALDLLQPLLGHAKDLGRIDLAIEIQILRALAYQAQGDDGLALDALAAALSLAEPGGYIRIFLDEGEPMLALLARAAARGIAPAYVATLLAAHGPEPAEAAATSPHPQPLVEPLSERELEVLRLLATGMSNPDIADELYIAVSTVRSHCKNIYGKLGVHSRWDAGQRGRELGLI
jgi:LuxR family maltose regulon positive regulatory protein